MCVPGRDADKTTLLFPVRFQGDDRLDEGRLRDSNLDWNKTAPPVKWARLHKRGDPNRRPPGPSQDCLPGEVLRLRPEFRHQHRQYPRRFIFADESIARITQGLRDSGGNLVGG